MQYFKINIDDKSFDKTSDIKIYQGEQNADYLCILIPPTYNGIDLSSCIVTMHYVTPDNKSHDWIIDKYLEKDLYKGYLLYKININKRFSSIVGQIGFRLTIIKPDAENSDNNIVLKTSSAYFTVHSNKIDIEEGIAPEELEIIDQFIIDYNEFKTYVETSIRQIQEDAQNGVFDGKDYVITENDYDKIAQITHDLVDTDLTGQINAAEQNLNNLQNNLASALNIDANNHIQNIENKANEKLEKINNTATGKVDIAQGIENANMLLSTDENGNVITEENNYVKFTDYPMPGGEPGVIAYADVYGLTKPVGTNSPYLGIKRATDSDIEELSSAYKPIVPINLKKAVERIGGTLDNLQTEDKSSYINAINETLNICKEPEWKMVYKYTVDEDSGEEWSGCDFVKDINGNDIDATDIIITASNITATENTNMVVNYRGKIHSYTANMIEIVCANCVSPTVKRNLQVETEIMKGTDRLKMNYSYKNSTGAYTVSLNRGIYTKDWLVEENINRIYVSLSAGNKFKSGTITIFTRKRW